MARTPVSVMLWTLKGSIEKRMELAAAAGYDGVGLAGEYLSWSDARIALMIGLASGMRLKLESLHCTPNWNREGSNMLDAAQLPEFLRRVRQAMVFCDKLNVRTAVLHCGNQIPGRGWEEQYACLLEASKRAADIAAKFGILLLIAPLNNKIDHQGYFLPDCANGVRLCREAKQLGVGLLFNVYHEQVQMGNVTRTLEAALPHVYSIQIADNPGRRQPGTGEISYSNLYRFLRAKAYRGALSMEFIPQGDSGLVLAEAVKQARAQLPN